MKKINISKTTVIKTSVFVILSLVMIAVVFLLWRKYFFGSNIINKSLLGKDMEFRYFIYDEFDSPLSAKDKALGLDSYYKNGKYYITNSGREKMQYQTIKMLDDARHIIEVENNETSKPNIYFAINSAVRTEGANEEAGGVSNSAHKRGFAVDIAWRKYSASQKAIIREALERVGFNRFGIANGFIHVDNDLTLPNPAVWGYS